MVCSTIGIKSWFILEKINHLFDGTNHSYWKERMEYHLEYLPTEIWEIIKTRYTASTNGSQTLNEIKAHENNVKARVAIISFLSDSIFAKVMGLKSAKQIWEKLSIMYEGDLKMKQAKLTNINHKFENLRMSNDENIERYLPQVNEILSAIRGIGGTLEESEFVRKVLLTLPKCYKAKKYTIEESLN